MKRVLTIAVLIALTVIGVFAQNENPRGIYHEMKLETKSGAVIKSPYDQYKICGADYALLLLAEYDDYTEEASIVITKNDLHNFTGERDADTKDLSLQIYDITPKEFTLKWYSAYNNHSFFPFLGWCREYYKKDSYSKQGKEIFKLLKEANNKNEKNPFIGTWRKYIYRPTTTQNDSVSNEYLSWGDGRQVEEKDEWKVYGKDKMLVLEMQSKGEDDEIFNRMYGSLCNVQYDNNRNHIVESKDVQCIIDWRNKDEFRITYLNTSKGFPETETWYRAELPKPLNSINNF